MTLKEILVKMREQGMPVLLSDKTGDWEAGQLLESLSEMKLKRQAYLQPGMYISEIDAGGYLGTVLYKLIKKD